MKIRNASLAVAGCAAGLALLRARAFEDRLNDLEAQLTEKRTVEWAAREDLPPEVLALAERLGASADAAGSIVTFEQSGKMWRSPGGRPLAFRARETMSTVAPGFVWRAVMAPLGSISVADHFVEGKGGLEARLFGAIRVARATESDSIDQGEMLRYLAELPWNPDAILTNRRLEWSVLDARTLKVAAGNGSKRGEVTFTLDEDGFVKNASAPSRLYLGHQGSEYRPWWGRFWNYQLMHGRRLPRDGEVAWVLDGEDFIYWRGRIRDWTPH